MYKKLLYGFIGLTILLSSFSNPVSAKKTSQITIMHNNKEQASPVQPESKNGTVFVPLRVVFDSLGINYDYNPKTKVVSASQGEKSISLVLNKKDAIVNGEKKTLETAVYTVNGYTFVPIRLISETFGAYIGWEPTKKQVLVYTDEKLIEQEKQKQQTNNNDSKQPIADEELKQLLAKFEKNKSKREFYVKYIIGEKKPASWLSYFIDSSTNIMDQLEFALAMGHVDAVDYLLTNHKHAITNEYDLFNGTTLYFLTYKHSVGLYYIYLSDKAEDKKEYIGEKTEAESLALIDLLVKHGYKPSGIDLLTTVTNYTYSQSAAIEKLIQAGADPNAAVPEHLTDGFRYIDFSRSDVLVPVIVQSYRGVAMYRTEEIIKTFATLVRNGGDLSLLSSEEKATIAELVKDNPKFTDIYELVK